MFPPYPNDTSNPYATGNAFNPLSVFAVESPIIQQILRGMATLGQQKKPAAAAGGGPAKPGTPGTSGPPGSRDSSGPPVPLYPPGSWPGIPPTPVPSPIPGELDPWLRDPIESPVSGVAYPTEAGGWWSLDPAGQPTWNTADSSGGGYIPTSGGYLDFLGGGGGDISGGTTFIGGVGGSATGPDDITADEGY